MSPADTSAPTALTGGALSGTRPAVRVVGGIAGAAVIASVVNALVAVVTRAVGASDAFKPLDPGYYIPLTVLGTVLACAGWALVRRTRNAASTFRWLVPVVLLLTFIPDILVGVGKSQTGTSWTAIAGLMVMHVVVAVTCVAVFAHTLPVSPSDAGEAS